MGNEKDMKKRVPVSERPDDWKVSMNLTVGEMKRKGFDLNISNFSNQLRTKLDLPVVKKESITEALKEARNANVDRTVLIEAIKKASAKSKVA